ncbi:MAG: fatty acid--CoA ligase family protein [Bacteroidota bacterium]
MEFTTDIFHALSKQVAIIDDQQHYTYADLSDDIGSAYRHIADQIPEGATVAMLSPCTYASIVRLFALAKNCNIVAPLIPSGDNIQKEKLAAFDPGFTISFDNGKMIISKNQPGNQSDSLVENFISNRHAGLVLFSSGTSGKPKAVLHDLTNLIAHYQSKKKHRHRIFMLFLLFDHIGGLNTIFNALYTGGCLVIPEKRSPEGICGEIEKHGVEILPVSPGFLNLLLMSKMNEQFDLSSLNAITYGTEPMPLQLLQQLKSALPKVRFIQTFGTSETGIIQLRSFSGNSTAFSISDPDVEYKIEEGELLIKSKLQFVGYLNNQAPARDGSWYATGDIVEQTEDGMLKIVGRKSNIINIGGQKVFPEEVESVLHAHPLVGDCVVYSQQNAITGQIVVCDVVIAAPNEGTEAGLKKELRSHCFHNLERYKVPVKFNIVHEIPRNNNTKINRTNS